MKLRKVEKEVRRIIDEMGISDPPIRVEEIAKRQGAQIHYEPFEGDDDISGVLYNDAGSCIIGINSAHAKTRQRFTLAHEIGHLVMHSKKIFVDKVVKVSFRDKRSSMAIDNDEIEANQFAAELLMPRFLIEDEITKLVTRKKFVPSKDWLINELASTFEVSPQSMEYRLSNLGIIVSQ